MSNKYLIIVEKSETGYSAYCPDVPGCVASAKSQQEVELEMKAALEFHLASMKKEGLEIPSPRSLSTYFEIDVA